MGGWEWRRGYGPLCCFDGAETAIFGVQDRAKLLNLFEETNDFK